MARSSEHEEIRTNGVRSLDKINPSAVYKRGDDIRYRIIDEEAVVIRQNEGEVLGINKTGARLLDLIDGERTVLDLVETMASEFSADRQELERDVPEFLEELRDAGIIEEASS
jgi:hypothetical protein